jgi:long-chain acyl-CoA synthetase
MTSSDLDQPSRVPAGSVQTVREIDAQLCAPGSRFEIETVDLGGRPTRVWKHAPRSLGAALDQGRIAGGNRDFIVLGDERLTHEAHYDRVVRVAAALADLGVGKGDRVAIAMRNLPEWSISFFAAAMAGAVAVPLNAFWNGDELAFAIGDCGASVLVADGERLERVAAHAESLARLTVVGTRLE